MTTKFFSDKFRLGKVSIIAILILVMCYYGYLTGPDSELTYQDCISDAEYFDGHEISLSFARVSDITPDHFDLITGDETVTVRGNVKALNLKKGDFVSLKAIYKKEGFLELKEIHVHTHEFIVFPLSFISLLIVAYFFFKEFKFDFKKLLFENKEREK